MDIKKTLIRAAAAVAIVLVGWALLKTAFHLAVLFVVAAGAIWAVTEFVQWRKRRNGEQAPL